MSAPTVPSNVQIRVLLYVTILHEPTKNDIIDTSSLPTPILSRTLQKLEDYGWIERNANTVYPVTYERSAYHR